MAVVVVSWKVKDWEVDFDAEFVPIKFLLVVVVVLISAVIFSSLLGFVGLSSYFVHCHSRLALISWIPFMCTFHLEPYEFRHR